MERVPVSNDDLMDVIELTDKLELAIGEILNGHQTTLAISAIISSSINCALSQCNTMQEIMIYRDMFVRVIDETIKNVHIKKKDS
jgi:hypothetical protein